MYESFFGLQQEPFSIAPDPRFLYLSPKHQEALTHLMYGLRRGGGFVLLTGEIGAGKTTVWRHFLEQLPARLDVAYVVNPRLDINALLTRVCEDLQVELPPGSAVKDPIDALHGHLLLTHARGRRALIVVDEAQALSQDVLEQLRLLTNLVTSERKLVQVLLIGQPELRTIIQHPTLEPLAQRVVARFHLPALPESETQAYIAHRMAVAGLQGELPFDAAALKRIHRLCSGVPRRINVLCDRALHAAHAAGKPQVDAAAVDRAASEVFDLPAAPASAPVWGPRLALAGMVVVLVLLGVVWERRGAKAPSATPAAVVAGAASVAAPVPVPAAASVPLLSAAATAPLVLADAAGSSPAGAPVGSAAAAAAKPTPIDNLDAAFGPVASDEAQAWRNLAGLWGVAIGPGEPCAAAALQSLYCYRGRGGLGAIRQLARPGIVRLSDEKGRVAHLLLVGLSDDSATVRIGAVEHTVTMALMARVWRGDFATFWRAPPGYRSDEIAPGTGPLVDWLDQHLAQAGGGAAAAAASSASAAASGVAGFRSRVYTFQLAHDLEPDGLPGPLTLIQLNRASGVVEPGLRTQP